MRDNDLLSVSIVSTPYIRIINYSISNDFYLKCSFEDYENDSVEVYKPMLLPEEEQHHIMTLIKDIDIEELNKVLIESHDIMDGGTIKYMLHDNNSVQQISISDGHNLHDHEDYKLLIKLKGYLSDLSKRAYKLYGSTTEPSTRKILIDLMANLKKTNEDK